MMQRMQITIFLLFALAITGQMQAAIQWDIYEDAVIDEVGDFYNRIRIYDTAPNHTTAIMVGGRVDVMSVYDASTLCITGGNVSSLGAFDSSTVNISGRAQIRSSLSGEWSTINISAGSIYNTSVDDYATLNISGGSVEWVLDVAGFATMNMTGGQINHLELYDNAIANLRGGHVSTIIVDIRDGFNGIVNIYGNNLVKTQVGGRYGVGQVYGVYPDGSDFCTDLGTGAYPYVNLIPEPATVFLFCIGGLFVKVQRK